MFLHQITIFFTDLLLFQVVPLTNKLGIIEWVENADVLNKLLEKQLNNKKCNQVFEKASQNYQLFVSKKGKKSSNSYGALQKCSRIEIVAHYQQLVNLFPNDLLR